MQHVRHEISQPCTQLPSLKDWWKPASVQQVEKSQESQYKRNEGSIKERPEFSISINLGKNIAGSLPSQGHEELATNHHILHEAQTSDDAMHPPETVLDLIRTQYQESLYASKVSTMKVVSSGPIMTITGTASIFCEGSPIQGSGVFSSS